MAGTAGAVVSQRQNASDARGACEPLPAVVPPLNAARASPTQVQLAPVQPELEPEP